MSTARDSEKAMMERCHPSARAMCRCPLDAIADTLLYGNLPYD